MRCIGFALILLFFQICHLFGTTDLLELPVHLGMERAEIEEILHAPLFSYAKVFHAQESKAIPAIAYALYKVPEWSDSLPSYILAFFLEGYTMRLIGIYQDQAYQKTAWNIANQPSLRAGRRGNIEYYLQKDYFAYYILQRVRPADKNSILNSQMKDLIFQTTNMPYFNIIFYHDAPMFELLYQSIKDLNLFSEIFKDLMKQQSPGDKEQGQEREDQGVPPDFPDNPGLPNPQTMPNEEQEGTP